MKRKRRAVITIILALVVFMSLVPVQNVKASYTGGKQVIADGYYRIVSMKDNAYGLDLAANSTEPGTNVQLYKVSDNDVPLFYVTYLGDGYYKISVPETNVCLDVTGGESKDGVNLELWTENNSDAQKWVIEDTGDGVNFWIRTAIDGRVIDISEGKVTNKQNIHIWSNHGGNNQKWRFVPDLSEGIQEVTAFGMACGVRLRWSMSSDTDDRIYYINNQFDANTGGSSTTASDVSSIFGGASVTSYPAGVEVKYKTSAGNEDWQKLDFPLSESDRYVDVTGLTGGTEYVFKMRPYYKTKVLGVEVGKKRYLQDWSDKVKQTTLEANDEDIKTADNVYASLSSLARKYGWYAGRHVQYYTGAEFCKYDIVSKNSEYQIWIGFGRKGSTIKYSWRVYDYNLIIHRQVVGGSLEELERDLSVYAANSGQPRLSLEYLRYTKGASQTISLVNTGEGAAWSLPTSTDEKVTYGGVELVNATANSVTVVFTEKGAVWGVYPYVEAQVGNQTYRCYIDNMIAGSW
ncbi:MAG: RICIN domain-containing protein [Lachnospiraceae bacterium]|nr:RICIN domain-containing protein [Lachnospiraceae bacterium]